MIPNHNPLAFSSAGCPIETEDTELRNRLGLYQVFLRLYEHNPGLLEEIISLEDAGSKALTAVSVPYIQGIVLPHQVYLVTNLLRSTTQALVQPQQVWTIGRDSRQVSLPVQDRRLSRRHAAIRYSEDQFYLVDLNSSNGSYVNGEAVQQAIPLKDGDRIRLGSLTFTFFVCQYVHSLDPLPPDHIPPVQFPRCSSVGSRHRPLRKAIRLDKQWDSPLDQPLEDTMVFVPSPGPDGENNAACQTNVNSIAKFEPDFGLT